MRDDRPGIVHPDGGAGAGSIDVAELPLIPDPAPVADPLHRSRDADTALPVAADYVAVVGWYHRRTKHHLHRYAPGPGHLDWATQPDPFRTYAGSPTVPLPLVADGLTPTFSDLYRLGAIARSQ